jgi:uncharacterized membrane protein
VVAAVGTGLNAGVFFAFSTFVMRAIRRLPPSEALAAMQSLNKQAPTPVFMTALFGTGAVCIAAAVTAARHLDEPAARYLLAGADLYISVLLVTIAYHVPHNDALALVQPTSPNAAHAWAAYAGPWTTWNHLRTIGSIAASVMFALALRLP